MVDFYRFKQFENYPKCIHAVSTKLISEPYDFSLALHTGEDVKSILPFLLLIVFLYCCMINKKR